MHCFHKCCKKNLAQKINLCSFFLFIICQQVIAAPLSRINFSRPQVNYSDLPRKRVRVVEFADRPHISNQDLQELKELAPTASFFTLCESSLDSDATDSASENEMTDDIPQPLTNLFDIRHQGLNDSELLLKVEEYAKKLPGEYHVAAGATSERATCG